MAFEFEPNTLSPVESFACDECNVGDAAWCMKAGRCEHRDGDAAAEKPVEITSFDLIAPSLTEYARVHNYRRIGINAYRDGRILAEGWWDAPAGKRGTGSGAGGTVSEALDSLAYYRRNGHTLLARTAVAVDA